MNKTHAGLNEFLQSYFGLQIHYLAVLIKDLCAFIVKIQLTVSGVKELILFAIVCQIWMSEGSNAGFSPDRFSLTAM